MVLMLDESPGLLAVEVFLCGCRDASLMNQIDSLGEHTVATRHIGVVGYGL